MSGPLLILASTSPRRRELLANAGFRFEVAAPNVPELTSDALTAREIALCNATRKALAAARRAPDAVVLGADTLVSLDHQIIGKPRDMEEAFAILRRLNGRTHTVCSAVVIHHESARRTTAFHVFSHVQFRKLTDRAIRNYLAKIDPLDKAGAYAAQSDEGEIIARVTGSMSNVIGLPMEKTTRVLKAFGIEPAR